MMKPPFRTTRPAFTLLELLIAVALIVILAVLAFPALAQMRRSSQRIQCMNNLRAYGNALFSYMADHDQMINFDRPNFNSMLVPTYLPETLRCPLISKPTDRGGFYTGNHGLLSYYKRPMMVDAPRHLVVFAAENYAQIDGFWSPTHFNMTVWGVGDSAAGNATAREENAGKARIEQHHGTRSQRRMNLFFLDGHIESLAPKDNDWWLPNTDGGLYYRTAGDGGIFYGTDQFRLISLGRIKYVKE